MGDGLEGFPFSLSRPPRRTGSRLVIATQARAGRRFADLPEILTPRELIEFLPIGRNAVYDALKTGAIKSIRVGQKFLVAKAAVREFLGGNIE
ncbi:MAG: helix-turn-helix domain-containing protein [Candidatus Velthaea sp.]